MCEYLDSNNEAVDLRQHHKWEKLLYMAFTGLISNTEQDKDTA